jgi:uncharacterized membrane protein YhhN
MDTRSFTLLLAPILIAVLDWIAVARRWRRVGYLTKPGVILALLAWLYAVAGFQYPLAWFAVGLLLSAAGDILLMLPRERFISGLVVFLLALVCYTIGLNYPAPPELNLPSILIIALVAFTSLQIFRRITVCLAGNAQGHLKRPLLAYMLVLSSLLISALLTLVRPSWEAGPALACSAGGLLFYLSDTLLAWCRFVNPDLDLQVLRRMTYQIAQILIILGVALQLG